jgi:GTP-binding protein HflX
LKDKNKAIDKQMGTQRSNRHGPCGLGGLYECKSTLMNAMGKAFVVENKLWTTTVRKVVIKNLPFLLSDTVGFIRNANTTG